jgi:hypothetical protein
MPAPIRPNTAAANETTRRRGDQTAAERLTGRGWAVLPPDSDGDADLLSMLATAFETHGTGCDHGEPACSDCLALIAVQTLLAGRVL